jgi:hypothetical protein
MSVGDTPQEHNELGPTILGDETIGHEMDPVIISGSESRVTDIEDLTFWEKVKDIAKAARNDFTVSGIPGKAVLGGFVGMVGYELGPGNETITPMIAGQFLDASNGVGGVAITAAAGALTVAGQQLTSGFFARKTAKTFPTVSQKTYEYMNSASAEKDRFKTFSDLSFFRKWYYGMFFGSSFTVTREAFVVGETDEKRLRQVGRMSSFLAASTTAVIAGGADTLNQAFPENQVVQAFMDHGVKNPLVWLGLGIITVGYRPTKEKIMGLFRRNNNTQQESTEGN